LLRIRRVAVRSAWREKDPWDAFHDLASINEYLREEQETVALFLELNRRSFKRAKRVYNLVEPALIRSGNYRLCGKYIDADRFARIRRLYRVNLRLAKDPSIGADYVRFAQGRFSEATSRLVALLFLNGRAAEAKRIGRQARRVWRNVEFHSRIASAERGEFASGDQS